MVEFDISWQDAPGVRDRVLARTWCALTIRIDDRVVTRVSDRRTRGWRDAVYGSVFPLCAWIVDNLWFLLYEPYRWPIPYGSRDLARNPDGHPWVHRHSLLAAREGGALPDLSFCRDGDAVLARWLRDGGDASHPFLRFVAEGFAHLDPDAVRAGFARLVDTVLARVADMAVPEVAELRDDWADLQSLAPDERDVCVWSARLGINAHYEDELSADDAERLRVAMQRLTPNLAGDLLDIATVDAIPQDIDWIEKAHAMAAIARRAAVTAPRAFRYDIPALLVRGQQRSAYQEGYSHARALREQAGAPCDVLPDVEAFVRRLEWASTPMVRTNDAPASRLDAMVDYAKGDVPFAACHDSAERTAQRFLLARSLFMQACSPEPVRRLVTGSHTWSQRSSRAFAAELLAPANALRQRVRGDAVSPGEVARLADEFGADTELIERQIENHAVAAVDRRRDRLHQW